MQDHDTHADSSSSVFFPQTCTHITHSFNNKGELRTAMVTGGNRLVFMKQGVVIAECVIPSDHKSGSTTATTTKARVSTHGETSAKHDSWNDGRAQGEGGQASGIEHSPLVQKICMCPFLNYTMRVVVATSHGVYLFEADDLDWAWQSGTSAGMLMAPLANGQHQHGGGTRAAGASNGVTSAQWTAVMHGSGAAGSSGAPAQFTASGAGDGSTFPHESGTGSDSADGGAAQGRGERVRCRRLQLPPTETELMPSAADNGASGRPDAAGTPGYLPMPYGSSVTPPAQGTSAPVYTSASVAGSTGLAGSGVAPGGRRRVLPVGQVRVSIRTQRRTVVAAEFITERSLCLVFDDEAVLVSLWEERDTGAAAAQAPHPPLDRIVWRSMGAYEALAVCRVNRHVALALGASTLVVFPCKLPKATLSGHGAGGVGPRGAHTSPSSGLESPVFSPTHNPLSAPSYPASHEDDWRASLMSPATMLPLDDGASSVGDQSSVVAGAGFGVRGDYVDTADSPVMLAGRGLTAALGIYRIKHMEWHRVSTHTLLCVTCAHPRDGEECVLLYTVQSLPTVRRFDNVLLPFDERTAAVNPPASPLGFADGDARGVAGEASSGIGQSFTRGHHDSLVQLVPSGTIPLTYTRSIRRLPHSVTSSYANFSTMASYQDLSAMGNHNFHQERNTGCNNGEGPMSPGCGLDTGAMKARGHVHRRRHRHDAPFSMWGKRRPPPVSLMLTGIVPPFSRSSQTASLSNKLQFLHVEGDGTVRTSCYRFGRQKHASFAKQRAFGLACPDLIAPLLGLYGPLGRITVLPIWKHRPVELGPITPQTELFMTSTRRYRFVAHFSRTGVVVVVMVDLQAAVFKVESFLTAGRLPIRSLLSFDLPGMLGGSTERLIAALMGSGDGQTTATPSSSSPTWQAAGTLANEESDEGEPAEPAIPGCSCVAVFSQSRTTIGYVTMLLSLSPLPSASAVVVASDDASASAAPPFTSVSVPPPPPPPQSSSPVTSASPTGEEKAQHFMSVKCPEKVKMFPALLKACGGDAERLLTQLTAKYGPLPSEEELPAPSVPHPTREGDAVTADTRAAAAAASVVAAEGENERRACYVLRGGCVTSDGVSLYVANGERGHAVSTDSPGFLVVIPPVALESLAPIHSRIAVGGVHVATAEYARVIQAPRRYQYTPPSSLISSSAPPAVQGMESARRGVPEDGGDGYVMGVLNRAQHQFLLNSVSDVRCEVRTEGTWPQVNVFSPTLPDTEGGAGSQFSLVLQETESASSVTPSPFPQILAVLEIKGQLLVSEDTIVGCLILRQDSATVAPRTELRLYGLPAVQSVLEADLHFRCECVMADVMAFFMGPRGEVVVVQEGGRRLSRWLRCFPTQPSSSTSSTAASAQSKSGGFHYVEDRAWEGQASPGFTDTGDRGGGGTAHAPPTIFAIESIPVSTSAVADASETSYRRRLNAQLRTHFLYATSACDYIRVKLAPFASPTRTAVMAPTLTTAMEGSSQSGAAPRSALGERCIAERGEGNRLPPVVQYHPDSVMQLIGVGRWEILRAILANVADAAQAVVDAHDTGDSVTTPDVVRRRTLAPAALAHELCSRGGGDSVTAAGSVEGDSGGGALSLLCEPAPVACEGLDLLACSLAESQLGQQQQGLVDPREGASSAGGVPSAGSGGTTTTTRLSEALGEDTSVERLTRLLPRVTLAGLSSRGQLSLLCIVQALHEASAFGRSVDEAASRFFFFYKLNALRRRLRLPDHRQSSSQMGDASGGVDPSSVLFFQSGKTAARNVTTASYLWAAMSDSQLAVMGEVLQLPPSFGAQSSTLNLTGRRVEWEQLELAGVPFWLRAPEQLRALADAVGRAQYQATQSIPECALMYCTARKPGTLAALCKTQNNTKLQAFFSRNFAEEYHRNAASANAFAAVSKNMPLYGAAFFVLAGDARSAAQVILQRQGNAALALFVLRASGTAESAADDLNWFREACRLEDEGNRAAASRPATHLDMWLDTCLRWLTGSSEERVKALRKVAEHPTAHPEVLSALRYARDKVADLSMRGDAFLPVSRELTCLLRLGRYCLARGLELNGELHYLDARLLLDQKLTQEIGAQGKEDDRSAGQPSGPAAGQLQQQRPKMQADYNTGTLVFQGFDDEDNGDDAMPLSAPAGPSAGDTCGIGRMDAPEGTTADVSTQPISPQVTAALLQEMRHVFHHRRGHALSPHLSSLRATPKVLPPAGQSEGTAREGDRDRGDTVQERVVTDVGVFSLLCPLLLSVTRQSPVDEVEGRLVRFLAYALAPCGAGSSHTGANQNQGPRYDWHPPTAASAPASATAPRRAKLHRTHEVFLSVLFLVLGELAVRARNHVLAHALRRMPVNVASLAAGVRMSDGVADLPHPVTMFVLCLGYHLDLVRAEQVTAGCRGRAGGGTSASAAAGPFAGFIGFDLENVKPPGLDDDDDGGDNHHHDSSRAEHTGHGDDVLGGRDGEEEENEGSAKRRNIFDELMESFAPAATPSSTGPLSRQGTTATTEKGPVGVASHPRSSAVGGPLGERSVTAATWAVVSDMHLDAAALQGWHYAWFSAFACLRSLRHLRAVATEDMHQQQREQQPPSPTSQRAIEAGLLSAESAAYFNEGVDRTDTFTEQHAFAQRLLLCAAMAYATLRFNTLSEDCFCTLHASLPGYDRSQLTNPNGVFIEMDRALLGVAEVLYAVLAATAAEVAALASADESLATESSSAFSSAGDKTAGRLGSFVAQHRLQGSFLSTSFFHSPLDEMQKDTAAGLLVQLCVSHAELFWQLPRLGTNEGTSSRLGSPRRSLSSTDFSGAYKPTLPSSWMHRIHDLRARTPAPSAVRARQGTVAFEATQHRRRTIMDIFDDPTDDPASFSAAPGVSVGDEVLDLIEAAWLRRHHTHRSLRDMMLRLATQGNLYDGPSATDRLLLNQINHSIQDINFDRSSCDSMVWSTEAGTIVGHGFRELLAADNEAPLQEQLAERNLATAAFSQGLSMQQSLLATEGKGGDDRGSDGGGSSRDGSPTGGSDLVPNTTSSTAIAERTAKGLLARRPLASVAAHGRPAPHPHLPFYLTCQPDGHLDLYPFASHGSVATYLCPRSFPMTPARYSPNGYLFVVGLQDGSIAGWRFTAAAIESAPLFFLPVFFTPSGVKAVFFCGERSSLVVGVGVVREPHAAKVSFLVGKEVAQQQQRRRAGVWPAQQQGTSGGGPTGMSYQQQQQAALSLPAGVSLGNRGGSSSGGGGLFPSSLTSSFAHPSSTTASVTGSASRRSAGSPSQAPVLANVGEVVLIDTELNAGAVVARCALPFVPDFATYLNAMDAVLAVSAEGLIALYDVRLGSLAVIGEVPLASLLASPRLQGAGTQSQQHQQGTRPPESAKGGGSSGAHKPSSHTATTAVVQVTALAASPYDDLIALGTSDGFALLLTVEAVCRAVHHARSREADSGEDPYTYDHPTRTTTSSTTAGRHSGTSGGGCVIAAEENASGRAYLAARATAEPFSVLEEATRVQVAPLLSAHAGVMDLVFAPSVLLAGLRDGKVVAASLVPEALRQQITNGA